MGTLHIPGSNGALVWGGRGYCPAISWLLRGPSTAVVIAHRAMFEMLPFFCSVQYVCYAKNANFLNTMWSIEPKQTAQYTLSHNANALDLTLLFQCD